MDTNLSQGEILIVEDDWGNIDHLTFLLRKYRAKIYIAISAEDALKISATIRPSLALIDLDLPGMDGWNLVMALREQSHFVDIPILAVTGFQSKHIRLKLLQSGFNGCFSKPLNSQTFLHDLDKYLKPQ